MALRGRANLIYYSCIKDCSLAHDRRSLNPRHTVTISPSLLCRRASQASQAIKASRQLSPLIGAFFAPSSRFYVDETWEIEIALALIGPGVLCEIEYNVIEQLQPSTLKPEDGYERYGMMSSAALGPECDNKRKQSFPPISFASPTSLYKGKDFRAGLIVGLMRCSETKYLLYNLITKTIYLCEWARPAHVNFHSYHHKSTNQ